MDACREQEARRNQGELQGGRKFNRHQQIMAIFAFIRQYTVVTAILKPPVFSRQTSL